MPTMLRCSLGLSWAAHGCVCGRGGCFLGASAEIHLTFQNLNAGVGPPTTHKRAGQLPLTTLADRTVAYSAHVLVSAF